MHVVADRATDGLDRRDVVLRPLAPEPQLKSAESRLRRAGSAPRRRSQPAGRATGRCCYRRAPAQSIRPASQSGKPAALRQRIPGRHVEPRNGDHRHARNSPQVQGFARAFIHLGRRHRLAFEQRAEVANDRKQILDGSSVVRSDIGAAGNAFLGFQVDQNQRPVGDRHDTGDDRAAQLQHHGTGADRSKCEFVLLHRPLPFSARNTIRKRVSAARRM